MQAAKGSEEEWAHISFRFAAVRLGLQRQPQANRMMQACTDMHSTAGNKLYISRLQPSQLKTNHAGTSKLASSVLAERRLNPPSKHTELMIGVVLHLT